MSTVFLEPLSVQPMTGLLTLPYQRGAEQLVLPLGVDAGNVTTIGTYNFDEYRSRYGTDPAEPKYVFFLKQDTGRDSLTIEVDFSFQGVENTVIVKVPARSFSNTSFAITLPATANATLRLLRFRQRPVPLPGSGANNFGILALLGNLSKLLWVIGWEKDQIRQHLRDIQEQRQRNQAHGFSLDQLGQDLRVPRFPAREYSFDSDTIALYHFNDSVQNGGAVQDETAKFGGVDHSGINVNAQSLAIGKFGNGFRFPGPNGDGAVTIANHAEFDLSATANFTAEVFINTDASDAPLPRVILNKGQVSNAGALTGPGWSLTVGSFRGISNNVRWAVSDGSPPLESFADLNIADGKFHHLAGVIDRASQLGRLFVDGIERASADITGLGSLTNVELIRIGRSASGHTLSGVVDEARFSRIARTEFHPVLSEGDDAYRRRLGIFERWLLPTPGELQQAINDLVHINNESDSFVLVEGDRLSAGAAKLIRILPASLPVGNSIDREGSSLAKEGDVSGSPVTETEFNPIYLLNHNRPRVDYGADPNNRLMQFPARTSLDTLIDLLAAANPPILGNLLIDKAFDPADAGLHRVGRALLMRHQTVALDQLGAMGHRAGFEFVRNQGSAIYASVAAGEKLDIVIETPPPAPGVDLFSGQSINLHVAPETLPTAGEISWTLIGCGAGRARLQTYEQATLAAGINAAAATLTVATPSGFPNSVPFKIRIDDEVLRVTAIAANTWTVTRGIDGSTVVAHGVNTQVTLADRSALASRPRLRLAADSPGEITLRVEYTFRRRVVSGLRTIRISIDRLANNASISAGGDMTVSQDLAVGSPGETINPIYLITSNVPGVTYGANPNNKKMQLVLERAFNALLATQPGLAAGLQVLKAFDPNDPGLHKAGRALVLRHSALTADQLGALAHQAQFGFVRRQGAQIFCAVAPGEKIEIARAAGLVPLEDELFVGSPVNLRVRFDPLPATGNFNWSLSQIGQGRGSLDFVLRPAVAFTPRRPGFLALNFTYLEQDPDSTFPYTFEIRLKPPLEAANAVIPKDQFDLIMNILNFFHPIGVEVATGKIRKHVVEVEQDPQKAFPAYTYPDFRV